MITSCNVIFANNLSLCLTEVSFQMNRWQVNYLNKYISVRLILYGREKCSLCHSKWFKKMSYGTCFLNIFTPLVFHVHFCRFFDYFKHIWREALTRKEQDTQTAYINIPTIDQTLLLIDRSKSKTRNYSI